MVKFHDSRVTVLLYVCNTVVDYGAMSEVDGIVHAIYTIVSGAVAF